MTRAGPRSLASRSPSPTPIPAPSASSSPASRAPIARRSFPSARTTSSPSCPGFKKFEQKGISLSAGQTATINVSLSVGNVSETITVTGESPVAQPGKIDLGRTIGEPEMKNLPLVSRNPYNFAFLQANVTGYENNEFGVPRINANGSQMHTNYQLDGNTNTEKDRAGLRLLPVSEVLVREVKVITNGFAPEFGQTTGMVYNAITPSGTNDLHGSASFRFKRNGFSTDPFFLPAGDAQARHRGERLHRRDRRPDPEGPLAFLRRVRVRRSQPGHRRAGDHRDAGQRRRARHHAAGRRRHPRAPAGELPLRQERLQGQRARTSCRCATSSSRTSRRRTSAAG